MEGPLTKEGNVYKTWKQRNFILKGTKLSYSNSKQEKGTFKIPSGTKVGFAPNYKNAKNKDTCFCIETPSRCLYLCAKDRPTAVLWLEALSQVKGVKKTSEIDREEEKVSKQNKLMTSGLQKYHNMKKKARKKLQTSLKPNEGGGAQQTSSTPASSSTNTPQAGASTTASTAPPAEMKGAPPQDRPTKEYKIPALSRIGDENFSEQQVPKRYKSEGDGLKIMQDKADVIADYPEAWLEDWWEPPEDMTMKQFPHGFTCDLLVANVEDEDMKITGVIGELKMYSEYEETTYALVKKSDKWVSTYDHLVVPARTKISLPVRFVHMINGKRPAGADDSHDAWPKLGQPCTLRVKLESGDKMSSLQLEQYNTLSEDYFMHQVPPKKRMLAKYNMDDLPSTHLTYCDSSRDMRRIWVVTYYDKRKKCLGIRTPKSTLSIDDQLRKDSVIEAAIDKRGKTVIHKEEIGSTTVEGDKEFSVSISLVVDSDRMLAYAVNVNIQSTTGNVSDHVRIWTVEEYENMDGGKTEEKRESVASKSSEASAKSSSHNSASHDTEKNPERDSNDNSGDSPAE